MANARPRSATTTRAAILDAARARFGADGYERTTMRGVARDVGVDPAMVIRYFGTKEALFAEAADLRLTLPDLTGVPPHEIAGRLFPHFFEVWEEDSTFLALLRASMTSPTAAVAMRKIFVEQVAPALAKATPDHPRERAAVLGSVIIGLVVTKYALRSPVLEPMDRATVLAWFGPLVEQALTGPPPVLPSS